MPKLEINLNHNENTRNYANSKQTNKNWKLNIKNNQLRKGDYELKKLWDSEKLEKNVKVFNKNPMLNVKCG